MSDRESEVDTELPQFECPHCGKESHLDDYGDYEAGDTFDCPKCDKQIHIRWTDITIHARLSTEASS